MKFTNYFLRQLIAFVVIVIFASLSLSCSSSLPTATDATKTLEAISQRYDNLFRVKNIHKTDGLESEINGVKQYKLTYQAEVECLKPSPELSMMEVIAAGMPPIRCAQAGDAKRVEGIAMFAKSEKGWQAVAPPFGLVVVKEIQ